MDINVAFYHGVIEQVRRVMGLLGPDRVDNGLTAFEDGASSWSNCFFARALAPEVLHSEQDVARLLDLKSTNGRWNCVPVRIVYHTFDGLGHVLTKDQLRQVIEDIRDESRPSEVLALIKSIDYTSVDSTPVLIG